METNLNYQRRLAETLVAGLGIEAAMDFARENNLDGVLAQMCLNAALGGGAPSMPGGAAAGSIHVVRGVVACRSVNVLRSFGCEEPTGGIGPDRPDLAGVCPSPWPLPAGRP